MEQLYARDEYGKTLAELGKVDPSLVVLDADLSGSTRTSFFAKEFPERFFNFGVAEQNMIAAAAGLAHCGKIVFASTFAMFASARVMDQVRNTVAYNKVNVKIVATHAGITVGEDGSSHQALEDINFMRAIPYLTVVVPCDGQETRAAIRTVHATPGPFYVRLGRSKTPTLEGKKEFVLGKGYVLREGTDIAIIACGLMVGHALQAAQILKESGVDATVANIHTIKPLDQDLIVALAKKHKAILVCEEHQITGGLFSAVSEVLVRRCPITADAVAVQDKFGQSGSPGELLEAYGLTPRFIVEKAKELLR